VRLTAVSALTSGIKQNYHCVSPVTFHDRQYNTELSATKTY